MNTDVVIVGGGPSGLLTALGLAQAGANVTVIEAGSTFNDAPRAVAYHYPVLPHLKRYGIFEDCVDLGVLRQDFAWRIFSTGELIRWDLSCFDGHAEIPYALHLHQGQLSQVLEKHLSAHSNVDIRYSTKLVSCSQSDTEIVAEVETDAGLERIEAAYLVGADGAGSFVRKSVLGFNFFGFTWPHRYVAMNMTVDLDPYDFRNIAMQIDHEHGAVICKLADPDFWRVTFMEDPALPVEHLPDRIAAIMENHLPTSDFELESYAPYQMHQRVTDRMREGRVLLVGDSAHVTNPTGGLGLTGAMFDAFALVELLSRVLHDGAADEALEFYERDRRRVFIEHTSPRASDNLRLMYYSKPGQAKEDWIHWAKTVANDPALMREAFSFTEQMETKV